MDSVMLIKYYLKERCVSNQSGSIWERHLAGSEAVFMVNAIPFQLMVCVERALDEVAPYASALGWRCQRAHFATRIC